MRIVSRPCRWRCVRSTPLRNRFYFTSGAAPRLGPLGIASNQTESCRRGLASPPCDGAKGTAYRWTSATIIYNRHRLRKAFSDSSFCDKLSPRFKAFSLAGSFLSGAMLSANQLKMELDFDYAKNPLVCRLAGPVHAFDPVHECSHCSTQRAGYLCNHECEDRYRLWPGH